MTHGAPASTALVEPGARCFSGGPNYLPQLSFGS